MFTGIVLGKGKILSKEKHPGFIRLKVSFPENLMADLALGASVSIDGVCLTVAKIEGQDVFFDVIQETLSLTTIGLFDEVNLERSLQIGDELGGHLVSGHVLTTAAIENWDDNRLTLHFDPRFSSYLFPKGYIAIDGISLTVADCDKPGTLEVALIPETLERTTLGGKLPGQKVNLEFDSQTIAIVETLKRMKLSLS